MQQTFDADNQNKYNKMEEFGKYGFNYNTKVYWGNSEKYFYYEGS
jgi:hypothetical protein